MHLETYSQTGQDLWVIGEVFNCAINGYFLDIGAHDGVNISNTYLLEKNHGWQGLLIEANPNTFKSLEANRSSKAVNTCLDYKEGEVEFALQDVVVNGGIVDPTLDNASAEGAEVIKVKTRRLEDVLEECGAPANIHYMSIDVEGAEARILLDFNFEKYSFACMTIERPSLLLRQRLADLGYVLVREVPGQDCFYIHGNLAKNYLNTSVQFYRRLASGKLGR
ncbi:MAG: FkbM family methyltransferase [Pseudomonadota bacterium]